MPRPDNRCRVMLQHLLPLAQPQVSILSCGCYAGVDETIGYIKLHPVVVTSSALHMIAADLPVGANNTVIITAASEEEEWVCIDGVLARQSRSAAGESLAPPVLAVDTILVTLPRIQRTEVELLCYLTAIAALEAAPRMVTVEWTANTSAARITHTPAMPKLDSDDEDDGGDGMTPALDIRDGGVRVMANPVDLPFPTEPGTLTLMVLVDGVPHMPSCTDDILAGVISLAENLSAAGIVIMSPQASVLDHDGHVLALQLASAPLHAAMLVTVNLAYQQCSDAAMGMRVIQTLRDGLHSPRFKCTAAAGTWLDKVRRSKCMQVMAMLPSVSGSIAATLSRIDAALMQEAMQLLGARSPRDLGPVLYREMARRLHRRLCSIISASANATAEGTAPSR